ncbi:MAG: MBL fold metallo-hydrolase [Firmicutes bacterium]|nr:MBL fold metallo-hydrolase [Bacillota bacterium]
MQLSIVQTGLIGTNTYIFDCGDALAVVDPGANSERILKAAEPFNKPIRHVLLTHAHWDHVGAVRFFQQSGARVYLHEADQKILKSDFAPDVLLKGGEELGICCHGVRLIDSDTVSKPDPARAVSVLHTPGHSAGSVCYLVNDVMFSGDTLFRLEIGRCDLATGSFAQMKNSLKTLFALKKDYCVLPGHGEETSLFFEKANNPYR